MEGLTVHDVFIVTVVPFVGRRWETPRKSEIRTEYLSVCKRDFWLYTAKNITGDLGDWGSKSQGIITGHTRPFLSQMESADKHQEPTLRFCSQTGTCVCNVDNSTGSVSCKVFHKRNEETINSPVPDQHCQRWTSRLSIYITNFYRLFLKDAGKAKETDTLIVDFKLSRCSAIDIDSALELWM
jgi:hypothetical protein